MVNFSQSEENYLKAIYHLQAETGKAGTSALAATLRAKPASVTDMTKKLNAKGLLHYKPYYGFSLTAEGKRAALLIIRRHRLWEFFLSEKLGFGWKEVHTVAEELEHVRSKKLIDKLDEYLGFPEFDPHGDPIPDARGRIRNSTQVSLAEFPMQQKAVVCQVSNSASGLLELLEAKHIRIGTRIEIRRKFPFDDSLQVRIAGRNTETISAQLAQNIFVK